MGIEIKTWQIIDNKLTPIDTTLAKEGRQETYDLEPWIESNPEIVGADIMIIGKQVPTSSGRIDLLGIDRSGNTVIIELKRNLLSRDVLAQAIDYASSVAEWTVDRLSEIYSDKKIGDFEDAFNETFGIDLEKVDINFNSTQRIIIIGFSIDSSLERMIEWLSHTYEVNINAVILSYVKTKGAEEHELLMKTSILSEEKITELGTKMVRGRFDTPGNYDGLELKQLLIDYLSVGQVTNQRIRKILLPALLRIEEPNKLTRVQLIVEFMRIPVDERGSISIDPNYDESKVGIYLTLISTQLSMEKNDFLRQIIAYEYPRHPWEKDNFSIRKPEGKALETLGEDGYRNLIKEILEKKMNP
jgi:hypothetical protein